MVVAPTAGPPPGVQWPAAPPAGLSLQVEYPPLHTFLLLRLQVLVRESLSMTFLTTTPHPHHLPPCPGTGTSPTSPTPTWMRGSSPPPSPPSPPSSPPWTPPPPPPLASPTCSTPPGGWVAPWPGGRWGGRGWWGGSLGGGGCRPSGRPPRGARTPGGGPGRSPPSQWEYGKRSRYVVKPRLVEALQVHYVHRSILLYLKPPPSPHTGYFFLTGPP